MSISIGGTPRFDMLRSLRSNASEKVAPQSILPPPATFAGKPLPDRFQMRTGASALNPTPLKSTGLNSIKPAQNSSLTFSALQEKTLKGPVMQAEKMNPFKLAAAGEPAHLTFAAQTHAPTLNYFNLKGNQGKIEPPVKSSAPSSAVILAIAGLSLLAAQVLAPAITLLKSGPLLSAVSQWNPLPAIKTYLQVLIPRV
jgi:hypothetical protein